MKSSIPDLEARLAQLEKSQAHLEASFHILSQRIADVAESTQATQAFGWDYVALTRRLSALEDHWQKRGQEPIQVP